MEKTTQQKLKLLFLPFLLIAAGTTLLYTFLNWLLIIKLQIINPKENLVEFLFPMILPWVPILIWLSPRIKLLGMNRKKGRNPNIGYLMIAWIAIFIPMMISQMYLSTATGKLTSLNDVSQINSSPKSKYYEVKNFYADKHHIVPYSSSDVSGKYNSDYNMHICIAVPLLNNQADTLNVPQNWISVVYDKTVSNHLSSTEKERAYDEFADTCQNNFDNKDLTQFVYLERIGNNDVRDRHIKGLKRINIYNANDNFFKEINEPFSERNGSRFFWIFASFIIGAVVWLMMVLIPKLDEASVQNFASGNKEEQSTETKKKAFNPFIPKDKFYITSIIIDINVLVFIVMVCAGLGFLNFNAGDLLNWGADYKPYVLDGQWWRLLTSIFVHGGLMHLLGNMYGLLFVGIFLEPVMGRKKFLILYLSSGVLSSVASVWWHNATVSIGASGAIFGMYGGFLALLLTKVFPKEVTKAFLLTAIVFVGFNLLNGINPDIDNAAHIGGLLSGFVIGLAMSSSIKNDMDNEHELNSFASQNGHTSS